MARPRQPWWKGALLYQIYPRSFADSNDDGIGDLPGVRARLDYLQWLGVDGIWLNPTFPSPNRDWGYDVADYCGVHPDLGTLTDLDELTAAAAERDIQVVLDLVPAHTSDRHAWFRESRSARESPRRDWYIWRDEADEQQSVFGGNAWTHDEATNQYYHHLFLPEQPDLNWLNREVGDAFEDILRFWFDRGIAGFRIDVVHEIVKDPPARPNPPQIHDLLRRWRTLANDYEPERLLLGETWLLDLHELVTFYGSGADELHLALNFPFMFAGLEAAALVDVVKRTEELLPAGATPSTAQPAIAASVIRISSSHTGTIGVAEPPSICKAPKPMNVPTMNTSFKHAKIQLRVRDSRQASRCVRPDQLHRDHSDHDAE